MSTQDSEPSKTSRKQNEALRNTHVRIDFSGCEYTTEFEDAVNHDLGTLVDIETRGVKTPAAGASLNLDIIIDFFSKIPDDIRACLVSVLIHQIWDTIRRHLRQNNRSIEDEVQVFSVGVRMGTFDITIEAQGGSGITVTQPIVKRVVDEARIFATDEGARGNVVNSITVTLLEHNDDDCLGSNVGHSSTERWAIEYREGNRGLFAYYDPRKGEFE